MADIHTVKKRVSNLFSLSASTRWVTEGRIGCNPYQNLVTVLRQYACFYYLSSIIAAQHYLLLCFVPSRDNLVFTEIAVPERNKDKAKSESAADVNGNKIPRESGKGLFWFCCCAFIFKVLCMSSWLISHLWMNK